MFPTAQGFKLAEIFKRSTREDRESEKIYEKKSDSKQKL